MARAPTWGSTCSWTRSIPSKTGRFTGHSRFPVQHPSRLPAAPAACQKQNARRNDKTQHRNRQLGRSWRESQLEQRDRVTRPLLKTAEWAVAPVGGHSGTFREQRADGDPKQSSPLSGHHAPPHATDRQKKQYRDCRMKHAEGEGERSERRSTVIHRFGASPCWSGSASRLARSIARRPADCICPSAISRSALSRLMRGQLLGSFLGANRNSYQSSS